jgi:hypothetical protein
MLELSSIQFSSQISEISDTGDLSGEVVAAPLKTASEMTLDVELLRVKLVAAIACFSLHGF